jgi:nicotinate-nucleotide adenylyltransferase
MTDPTGIVVFGGAFNPPHRTHRKILRTALDGLPAAGAIVLPTGRHPHKRDRDMAPDAARLQLCAAAFGDLPGVEISDVELRREGPAYTVDTARELARTHPDQTLFLLVGSDNLRIIDSWHDHHELLDLVTVVTYPRRRHPVDRATLESQALTPAEIDGLLRWVLDVDLDAADDVSATAIRAALRRGEEPAELADPVAGKIRELGLYTS